MRNIFGNPNHLPCKEIGIPKKQVSKLKIQSKNFFSFKNGVSSWDTQFEAHIEYYYLLNVKKNRMM